MTVEVLCYSENVTMASIITDVNSKLSHLSEAFDVQRSLRPKTHSALCTLEITLEHLFHPAFEFLLLKKQHGACSQRLKMILEKKGN